MDERLPKFSIPLRFIKPIPQLETPPSLEGAHTDTSAVQLISNFFRDNNSPLCVAMYAESLSPDRDAIAIRHRNYPIPCN